MSRSWSTRWSPTSSERRGRDGWGQSSHSPSSPHISVGWQSSGWQQREEYAGWVPGDHKGGGESERKEEGKEAWPVGNDMSVVIVGDNKYT